MKISELSPKQSNVNIEAEVVSLGSIREFTKFGKVGKVCNIIIKDNSGQVALTLWNDQTDLVKEGSKIKINNGYVGEYQGELQLTTGKFGSLEVL